VRQFGLRKGDHLSGSAVLPTAPRRTRHSCASTRSTAVTPKRLGAAPASRTSRPFSPTSGCGWRLPATPAT
jgi:hypothetical protein